MSDNDSMFDKMLEMGMGMAVANQIPKMMESMMPNSFGSAQQAQQSISTRQGPPPITTANIIQFYAIVNNSQVGPLSEQEFIALIQKNLITASTLIWKQGMENWQSAQQVPEAGKLLLLYAGK